MIIKKHIFSILFFTVFLQFLSFTNVYAQSEIDEEINKMVSNIKSGYGIYMGMTEENLLNQFDDTSEWIIYKDIDKLESPPYEVIRYLINRKVQPQHGVSEFIEVYIVNGRVVRTEEGFYVGDNVTTCIIYDKFYDKIHEQIGATVSMDQNRYVWPANYGLSEILLIKGSTEDFYAVRLKRGDKTSKIYGYY